MTIALDKRTNTVTMPADLALALFDAVSFPPVNMKGAHTGIPREWIAEIRTMLDDQGFDWRGVNAELHGRIAERAKRLDAEQRAERARYAEALDAERRAELNNTAPKGT